MSPSETRAADNRRSIRTLIQTGLSAAATLLIVVPIIAPFIDEWFPGTPATIWLATGAAFIAGLAAVIAKIMAIPEIDVLLSKIKLGKNPRGPRHAK